MSDVAEIRNDGTFVIEGNVDTRLPAITDGLIVHYPFDGTLSNIRTISSCRVGGYFANTGGHPWYNWFQTNAKTFTDIPVMADLTVEQAKAFDLIIVDAYVFSIPSTIIAQIKTFVDAGISVIGTGNDTTTNIFALTIVTIAGADHTNIIENNLPFGLDGTSIVGGTDPIYQITSLAAGCTPICRRTDTNNIMGYMYTSQSGAVFIFDEEGTSGLGPYSTIAAWAAGQSVANVTNTNNTLTSEGIAVEEATTNLYSDGDFALKTLHTVRDGPWTFPTGVYGPNGSQVIMVIADGTTSYHGKDITVVIGTTYTMSCWIYVSGNCDSTSTALRGEQGFAGYGYYNLSNKGTWQYVTNTMAATTTSARILAYQISSMTKGYCLFSEIQFEQKTFPTSFAKISRSVGDLTVPAVMTAPYSVVLDFSPKVPNSYSLDYNWIFSPVPYDNFLMWKRGTEDYYRIRIGGGADYTFLNTDIVQYGRYKIVLTVSPTETKIYLNGTYKGTIASMFNISAIKLGSAPANDIFYSLSFYNKLLSDTEVSQLEDSFNLQSNGDLIVPSIVSEPIVPNNSKYFPLGCDAKDVMKIVSPSTEINTVYDDDGVWIGGIATNVVSSNGDLELGTTSGWVIASGTTGTHSVDSSIKHSGKYSLKVNVSNGGDQYQYISTANYGSDQVGNYFTVSGYIKTENIVSGTKLMIYWRDSAGSWIFLNNVSSEFINSTTDWVRVSATAAAPTGAYYCVAIFAATEDGVGSYWIDDVQIEKTPFVTPYTLATRGSTRLEYSNTILNVSAGAIIGWWKFNEKARTWRGPTNNNDYHMLFATTGASEYNKINIRTNYTNPANTWYYDTTNEVGGASTISFTVTDGWHMIAACWDKTNTKKKILVDGVLISEVTTTALPTAYSSQLFVGNWDTGQWGVSNLYMKDLMILDYYPTDSEITDIFRNKLIINKDNLQIQNKIITGQEIV